MCARLTSKLRRVHGWTDEQFVELGEWSLKVVRLVPVEEISKLVRGVFDGWLAYCLAG